MAVKFLSDISTQEAIQFKNASGSNAGKIDQVGDNLVISNAIGDILFGDTDADVYIGDGVNSVDVLFEQSGSIKAEDGSTGVTLTLGSSDTTLNLYNPQIGNGMTLTSTMTIGSGGTIDYTPDTGTVLSFDSQSIIRRLNANGGISIGHDDQVIIAGGDTSSTMDSNITGEVVAIGAEGGLNVYAFPNNDTSWSNRVQWNFSNDSYLTTPKLKISSPASHTSEATALMIDGSNIVGTRELGSLAFSSATYDNYGSWNLKTGGTQRTTVGSGGTLDIVGGTNVTATYSAGGVVTLSSTDTDTWLTNTNARAGIVASGAGQINKVWKTDASGNPAWRDDANTANTNYYLSGASFATSTGVLTLTVTGATNQTVDLDGRYLTSYTETDTLDSVADRGATTNQTLTVGGITTGGVVTTDVLNLTNDATDTTRHRITVYDSGSTSYGMMLWNTNGTSGDWATMIYGPNQSNRRISFGKANANFATNSNHAGVDEIAYFDLDNSHLYLDGRLYPSGSTSAYVDSTRIGNWNTAYGWGDHASAGYLTTSSAASTYATTDHGHSDATTSSAGFMSSGDKTKLDGIASSANNYSLPTASSTVLGGIKVGTNLSISNGVLSATDTDTWVSNTNARAGYVASGAGQVNKVWKTDASGNPAWREDTDTNTNYYVSGLSFATGTGVLTATVSGATNQTVDLDGRYLELGGGTMTGNIILGSNKIAADTTSPTAHIQVGAGTTNTGNRSDIALLGGSNSGGVINALGLVNTAAGANSNGVALNFHNGNAWSPTGQILVQQDSTGTSTNSAMKFYTYAGGLNHRMAIKSDGTIRFNAYGAGLIASDSSGNLSVDTSTYLTGVPSKSVGIAELDVTDGTSGQVLTTDGNGTLSFSTVSAGGSNYYLDGITRTASTNTLVFSVSGTTNQSYTFGANAFTSYTDHSTQGYLTSETYTAHENTSDLSGTYGDTANGTKIDTITVDANGHITAIATGATGNMTGFYVEDGDGTEVQINNANEWKFVEGGGIDINWTDTSTGSDADPYDLSFSIAANGVSATQLNVVGDGTSGQVLTSDGDGSFSWTNKTTNTNTVTSVGVSGSETTGTVTIAGSGATTVSQEGSTITIDSTNTQYSDATTSASGLMSSTDKTKLDGVASGADVTPSWVPATNPNYLTAHPSISAASSSDNSGRTYIQDITLDSNGHVTGITTATETVTNTNTTYSAGSGLDLTSTTFSVEPDLRDGITHIGKDANNYITFDSTNGRIDFYAGGVFVARMESDGDLHVKGDVIAFSSIFA